MVDGSTRDSSDSPRRSGGHRERFATLVEADRALILASYEQGLVESQSPAMDEPSVRARLLACGEEIVHDIAESVRADTVQINEFHKLLAGTIDETRAASGPIPEYSLLATLIFFNVTVGVLGRHVGEDPELLSSFLVAVIALNESINKRIRTAALAHTEYQLDFINAAQMEERRRIARELHDRLGEGVSGALRQLELHELKEADCPIESAHHTTLAKKALIDAMDRLRFVISDLRREPVTDLGRALAAYIDSAAPDLDVRLRVSGDESWATPTVIDEVYLIVREALRNALAHAVPRQVLVGVDLTPHELRAWVEDDGRGMEPGCGPIGHSAGTAGLIGMRERAALIGGSLTLSSTPGRGTRVDLLVPLPGSGDERSG